MPYIVKKDLRASAVRNAMDALAFEAEWIMANDPSADALGRVVIAALQAHKRGNRAALLAGAAAIERKAKLVAFPLAKQRAKRAELLAQSIVGLSDPDEIARVFFEANYDVAVGVIQDERASAAATGRAEAEAGHELFRAAAAPIFRMVKGRPLSLVNAETLVKSVALAFGVKRPAELFRKRESKPRKPTAKP